MSKYYGRLSGVLLVALIACESPQELGGDKSGASVGGKSSRGGSGGGGEGGKSQQTGQGGSSAGNGGTTGGSASQLGGATNTPSGGTANAGAAGSAGGANGAFTGSSGTAGGTTRDTASSAGHVNGAPTAFAGSGAGWATAGYGGTAGYATVQGGFAGSYSGTLLDSVCMDERPFASLDLTCPPTYCAARAQVATICGTGSSIDRDPPSVNAAYEVLCSNLKDILVVVNAFFAYGCRYQNNVLVGSYRVSNSYEYCGGATPSLGVGARPKGCSQQRTALCDVPDGPAGTAGGGAAGAAAAVPGAAGAAQTGNGACYDADTDSCVSCS